jgi:hypothetical protein
MAAQGQRIVLERFSLTHMADEIEAFLEQALKSQRLAAPPAG